MLYLFLILVVFVLSFLLYVYFDRGTLTFKESLKYEIEDIFYNVKRFLVSKYRRYGPTKTWQFRACSEWCFMFDIVKSHEKFDVLCNIKEQHKNYRSFAYVLYVMKNRNNKEVKRYDRKKFFEDYDKKYELNGSLKKGGKQ